MTLAAAAAAHDWHVQLCPLPLACPSWLHIPRVAALCKQCCVGSAELPIASGSSVYPAYTVLATVLHDRTKSRVQQTCSLHWKGNLKDAALASALKGIWEKV